jgi:ribosomal protein S18 acetylase RimI-like enzyme
MTAKSTRAKQATNAGAAADTLVVRPAQAADGPALGRMGVALARLHHEYDAARFMMLEGMEPGYRDWLLREAGSKKATVWVAERAGVIVGYGYGRLEGRDWNKLLDAHGELVDLWVDDASRGQGAGARLVEAVVAALVALGAPRVVLTTAAPNATAQRLFARLGFRATMIEMTREAGAEAAPAVAPKQKRRGS